MYFNSAKIQEYFLFLHPSLSNKMKKILLMSDTHGYLDKAILKYVDQADEVWHAGDIGSFKVVEELKKHARFKAVYGNIDGQDIRSEFPLKKRFSCEKVRVLMTHIGGYPGRYTKSIKPIVTRYPPNLFISGHSHILRVMYDKKLGFLHLNPGAVGIEGYHHVRTMLRFEINNKEILNLEVIELGKRG